MIYKTIQEFLIADNRQTVIFTCANYAIVEMTENLVRSANKTGVPLVVFALDEKIANALDPLCTVVMYDLNITDSTFYAFGEEDYAALTFSRWAIWGNLLARGRTIIHLDADIVILKNFVDDVLQELQGYDCVMQHVDLAGNPEGCPGFLAVKPGVATRMFTIEFLAQHNYKTYINDQDFFNKVVGKKIEYTLLALDNYPHFKHYKGKQDALKDKCYIIHFNFIIGYQPKIEEMKNCGLWDICETNKIQ